MTNVILEGRKEKIRRIRKATICYPKRKKDIAALSMTW
jgi:hypothetical protein